MYRNRLKQCSSETALSVVASGLFRRRCAGHSAVALKIGLCLCAMMLAFGAPALMADDQAQGGVNAEENAGIQPEVVIRDKPDRLIEEYRKGGRIVMIKVTPKKGVVYYLVDTDGDGYLDTRENQLPDNVLIPQWKIFQWK